MSPCIRRFDAQGPKIYQGRRSIVSTEPARSMRSASQYVAATQRGESWKPSSPQNRCGLPKSESFARRRSRPRRDGLDVRGAVLLTRRTVGLYLWEILISVMSTPTEPTMIATSVIYKIVSSKLNILWRQRWRCAIRRKDERAKAQLLGGREGDVASHSFL